MTERMSDVLETRITELEAALQLRTGERNQACAALVIERTARLAADARADKAEAALAETREALKPFAGRAARLWEDQRDDVLVHVRAGEFRAARLAVNGAVDAQ